MDSSPEVITIATTSTTDPAHPDAGPPEADHHEHEHEHRSGWPIVAAAGVAGLYVGVALAFVGRSIGTVPVPLGVALAIAGALGFVVGLGGWFGQAFLGRAFAGEPDPRSRELYVATMLVFLITDLSTFAAGFIYYAFVRGVPWPPVELPPLLGSIVLVNTAILLTSSVTFHLAHGALERGRRRRFLALLGLTVALGVVFLGGQVLEYYEFVVHEGFTLTDGVFASAFYGLTGLHGLHVTLGVVLLSIVFARGLRGHYGPDRDTSVATVGYYWHFVDAVWVALVAAVYVGASV